MFDRFLVRIKIIRSFWVIRKAFRKFYSRRIAIAWTGGKDSTFLLWIVRSFCQRNNLRMPRIMFINEGDLFPEIENFIKKIIKEWSLEVDFIQNNNVLKQINNIGDMVLIKKLSERNQREIKKLGFKGNKFPFYPESFIGNHLMKTVPMNVYLEEKGIKALFTGIRWDEQNARSKEFYFSPRINPEHIRVHPLLHFSEKDIWKATFKLKIPYSRLYHDGYRSLGAKTTTGKVSDIPAWRQDLDHTSEREGRQQDKEKIMEKLRKLGYM